MILQPGLVLPNGFELQPYKPSLLLRITILTPCIPMVSDEGNILPTREKGGKHQMAIF